MAIGLGMPITALISSLPTSNPPGLRRLPQAGVHGIVVADGRARHVQDDQLDVHG